MSWLNNLAWALTRGFVWRQRLGYWDWLAWKVAILRMWHYRVGHPNPFLPPSQRASLPMYDSACERLYRRKDTTP